MNLYCTINSAPVPCARARVLKTGRSYTPKRTADWQNVVMWAAKAAMAKNPLWAPGPKTRFMLYAHIYRAADRGDLDNYIKGIMDGMTKAGIWADDRLVHSISAMMYVDKLNPRVEIAVDEFTI